MSILRQKQIRGSLTYDDTLAASQVSLEPAEFATGSTVEQNFNGLRSQVNKLLHGAAPTGSEFWYTAPPTRGLIDVDSDLTSLQDSTRLCRVSDIQNIAVGSGVQFVALSQLAGETPLAQGELMAVDASTAIGAVVATLPGAVGTSSTNTVAGYNALSPKNLVILVDSTNGEPLDDGSGNQVFGLIQVASGSVDGTFPVSATSAQISLVTVNAGRTGFDLFTTTSVLSIEYAYAERYLLATLPEDCGLQPAFADNVASVDVTLTNAIANQGAVAVGQTGTLNWDIADVGQLNITSTATSDNLITLDPDAGGDTVTIGDAASLGSTLALNSSTLDVNSTTVDFSQGISVDTTDQTIGIGVDSAGEISSSGALTLDPTGNLTVDLQAGEALVSSQAGADTNAVQTLTTTGTGGDSVNIYTGNSSPDTRFAAPVGSIFYDGTGGGMWINTDGTATGWEQVQVGAESAESLAATLLVGNTTGATPIVIDNLLSGITTTVSNLAISNATGGGDITLSTASGETLVTGAFRTSSGTFTSDSSSNTFLQGVTVDTGGQTIDLGASVAGTITSSDLTIATSAGTLLLNPTGDLDVRLEAGEVMAIEQFGADTNAILNLNTLGTGGDSVGVFVGSSSPDGRVTGSLGSLFIDGTNGTLWQNIDGATDWELFQAGSPVAENRQDVYDSQGTVPVNLTTSATLDLEGAGLVWSIRDDLEANLFSVTEGSAGGTSTVTVDSGVDVFDVNAAQTDIDATGQINLTSSSNEINLLSADGTSIQGSTVDIRSANAPAALPVVLTAGNSTTAATAGSDIDLQPGDGGTTGTHGAVHIQGAFLETEAYLSLTSTGTAEAVQLFAGSSDPDTVVTADPGSLFLRDDGASAGELYVSQGDGAGAAGTDWNKVITSGGCDLTQATVSSSINGGTGDATLATLPVGSRPPGDCLRLSINGVIAEQGAGLDYSYVQATGVITWQPSAGSGTGTGINLDTNDRYQIWFMG